MNTLDSVLDTSKLTEEYWAARNALVDAVRTATPATSLSKSYNNRTAEDHALVAAYNEKLAALKAFDAAHGGTPVL